MQKIKIEQGFAVFSENGDTAITAASISCDAGNIIVHESELWAVWEALNTLELNPRVTHVIVDFLEEIPVLKQNYSEFFPK